MLRQSVVSVCTQQVTQSTCQIVSNGKLHIPSQSIVQFTKGKETSVLQYFGRSSHGSYN